MCEANVYLKEGENEVLFMEAVDIIEPYEDGLKLIDIFGKQKFLWARIKNMTLLNHRILLEQTPISKEATHASSDS
ncbi:CooT family nickel-binding protein [Desulfitobacterium sp.]|uniref:CooT family nickel-binding protein n=1 Tax=Desulfitobacterium sp. TaxID=49981 RepID=UPI002BBD2615|nr:CooT family nickel-binding protein [Desulfitobacterium sp.]HVJ48261.1 CooT family nickel-binding protein [Desulfitobacterium sp.]